MGVGVRMGSTPAKKRGLQATTANPPVDSMHTPFASLVYLSFDPHRGF